VTLGDLEGADEMVTDLRGTRPADRQALLRPPSHHLVGDLPKTRSGKIMRRLLRDIDEGRGRESSAT